MAVRHFDRNRRDYHFGAESGCGEPESCFSETTKISVYFGFCLTGLICLAVLWRFPSRSAAFFSKSPLESGTGCRSTSGIITGGSPLSPAAGDINAAHSRCAAKRRRYAGLAGAFLYCDVPDPRILAYALAGQGISAERHLDGHAVRQRAGRRRTDALPQRPLEEKTPAGKSLTVHIDEVKKLLKRGSSGSSVLPAIRTKRMFDRLADVVIIYLLFLVI